MCIRDSAYTDNVTGGWNQFKFYKETEKIKFDEGKYAIGYINIENFKYINDFYGREQGDLVLKFMSRMLDDMMQPDGIYARVLADRFVFLTPYIDYETLKYNFETYISNIEINISGFADSVIVKSTCGVYLAENEAGSVRAVSYTHLTLPTKRIVEISVGAGLLKKKKKKRKGERQIET